MRQDPSDYENAPDYYRHAGSDADCNWQPRGLGEPTSAHPGSAEKVEVMYLRMQLGLDIWHPDDVQCHFIDWPHIWELIDRGDQQIVGKPGQYREGNGDEIEGLL